METKNKLKNKDISTVGKIKVICDFCNKTFVKYANGSVHNFCCKSCKSEWQKDNLIGKNNPFYGRNHTLETKQNIVKVNSKPSKKKGCKQPETTGKLNPAYKHGYWMVRKRHIELYKKSFCEDCNSEKDLIIHHAPFMDVTNCLNWDGEVITLCIQCHINRHRNKKGQMERIYD
jgi:hypothetical protein